MAPTTIKSAIKNIRVVQSTTLSISSTFRRNPEQHRDRAEQGGDGRDQVNPLAEHKHDDDHRKDDTGFF